MRPEVLNAAVSDKLWTAINQDGLAAFAKRYPSTVTLATVPVTAPLHGRRPPGPHTWAPVASAHERAPPTSGWAAPVMRARAT